jgi:hypothetical protein
MMPMTLSLTAIVSLQSAQARSLSAMITGLHPPFRPRAAKLCEELTQINARHTIVCNWEIELNSHQITRSWSQSMGNIKVGGNVVGSALAAGSSNVQTVTFSGPDAAEREKVFTALQAIQTALGELRGAPAKSAQREAAAAVDAAKAQEADKDEIGSALETALQAAKKAEEFATISSKLLPLIQTVATWLGGGWTGLISLLL